MCAIMGVSFAEGSTINRQKLLGHLLTEGQIRGSDASGYAFVRPDGTDDVYKKNVPGSRLYTGKMAKDATAMIIHTRASTHGPASDNDNNHPVLSPSGNLRLIHNGVIDNHTEIREMLGKAGKGLPEVDTAVLPAVIEILGLDATENLGGYASAAWFDRETDDTIHLARFKSSTVYFATLEDGSFAFASTAAILANALNKSGLYWYGSYPDPFDSMDSGDYYQLRGGELIAESEVEWNEMYFSKKDWSRQTSGGESRGFARSTDYVSGSEYGALYGRSALQALDDAEEDLPTRSAGPLFSETGTRQDDLTVEEYDNWVKTGSIYGVDSAGVVIAETYDGQAATGGDPDMPDVTVMGYPNAPMALATDFRPMFYTEDYDGDRSSYTTLKGLTAALSWNAGRTDGENYLVEPDGGNARFANHFADVGALSEDGSEQFSWVLDEANFQVFADEMPGWVSEGIGKLRQLVGS